MGAQLGMTALFYTAMVTLCLSQSVGATEAVNEIGGDRHLVENAQQLLAT
jgi:hypothetical protein